MANQFAMQFLAREDIEGRRHNAYLDSGGVPTIGVGHTGPEVHIGLTWTDAQIDAALADDVTQAEAQALRLLTVALSQQQMAAVISFVFNLGSGALASSHFLISVNQRDWLGAAKDILRWDHVGQIELRGLLIRRMKEAVMFLEGS